MDSLNPASKKILVVEDNPVALEGLAVVLGRAGYAVATAINGREALDYLHRRPPPDLIVLDMLMPVLDGWHFLAQVRREPWLARVPVVVTTGTILTPEWANSQGCAGLLRKPVDEAELLREVGRCLAVV
jgi:CheY-like chemotaxis protein